MTYLLMGYNIDFMPHVTMSRSLDLLLFHVLDLACLFQELWFDFILYFIFTSCVGFYLPATTYARMSDTFQDSLLKKTCLFFFNSEFKVYIKYKKSFVSTCVGDLCWDKSRVHFLLLPGAKIVSKDRP